MAIRFNLLRPDSVEYQGFMDGSLAILTKAKRAAADQRPKEAGRAAARVAELLDDVFEVQLGTAEPVARVRLFEVFSGEQFR